MTDDADFGLENKSVFSKKKGASTLQVWVASKAINLRKLQCHATEFKVSIELQ